MYEGQTQGYIETFFETYKRILPYFDEEYGRLTDQGASERVLKNSVTGRIRKFRRRRGGKLMRKIKPTLLRQVEFHLLKLSLIRLRTEIKRRGLDARIVACIHDSIWVEASGEKQGSVRRVVEGIMITAVSL